MALRYTLGSDSRLKREQHIQTLFRSGKAFSVFPVRIVWLVQPGESDISAVRVGFSAPKKKFRRAVDRGRIKRLLRESWRLQQQEILAVIPAEQQLQLFILFTDTKLPEYQAVFNAIGKAIAQLKKMLADA